MTLEDLKTKALVTREALLKLYSEIGNRNIYDTFKVESEVFCHDPEILNFIFKEKPSLTDIGARRQRALERHWWTCATYTVARRQGVDAALIWRLGAVEPRLPWLQEIKEM